MTTSAFNQQFFDKWYRSDDPRFRAGAWLKRHASVAIAAAEYLLDRPIRTVLDVGCGEGEWRAVFKALRPRASYMGIDPSEYVVQRYGTRRNISLGGFDSLGERDDLESFDLIVCVDALHYVAPREITRGARALGQRLSGVALLHAFARGDAYEGDTGGITNRPAQWYRDTFRRAGLTPLGLACWAGRPLRDNVSALERG